MGMCTLITTKYENTHQDTISIRIQDTVNQKGYPLEVEYPEIPSET